MLEEGSLAPDFELPDQDGRMRKLSDFKGKKVILYFYPKDNTPGCTIEASKFRDDYSLIKDKGAVVIGVSKDSVVSHKKFREKHDLPFILLSDESAEMIKAYGAWQLKKFMGREYMGIARISYLIDEEGKIIKAFPKVNTKKHSKEVLDHL